jgi:hypothetical protein
MVRIFKYMQVVIQLGKRQRSWLRHCPTNRKVASFIPDWVTGIVHGPKSSGRTMALGSHYPLTEMSTSIISWRLRRPMRKANNLTNFMCQLS